MEQSENVVALRDGLCPPRQPIVSGVEHAPVYWIVESRTGRVGVRKQFPTQKEALAYATESAARHREIFDVYEWTAAVALRPQVHVTLAERAP